MSPKPNREITNLLLQLRQGNRAAESVLAGLVYEELRRIAKVRLRGERAGHSLQPTMLVNDAYLQLVAQKDHDWQNRSHFFAVAAQLMRRILIDHARWVNAEKRGGGQIKLALDFDIAIPEAKIGDLLAVDQALQRLEQLDPRQCRIVELRFFGGLTKKRSRRFSASACER